jgi:hypothetical protein
MKQILGAVDTLLRGGFNRRPDTPPSGFEVAARTLTQAGLLLGVSYGIFMGLFAALRGGDGAAAQILSTMVKVPAVFLLTLLVTFPSLYVFSALSGSRLTFRDTLRLLLAAITVNLALLASFGPVTGFFTLSTDSYPFMILLNVAFFALSGAIGLMFLRRALDNAFIQPVVERPIEISVKEGTSSSIVPPPPPPRADPAVRVFRIWTFIYAVVGSQMGWVLRPFIGAPSEPFQLFRARQSNFFTAVIETIGRLLS